ncbi:hypothetical protein QW180_06750 [Vibrio sinaloensis]|nr:hypothetical protein [Vibrio sinaloensis]
MLTNLPAILRQAELISSAQEQSVIEQINASGHAASEALLALELFDSQQLTQHLERLFFPASSPARHLPLPRAMPTAWFAGADHPL